MQGSFNPLEPSLSVKPRSLYKLTVTVTVFKSGLRTFSFQKKIWVQRSNNPM